MDAKLTRWILPVLLLIITTDIWAQGPTGTDVSVDSSVSVIDTLPQKKSFFKKFLDYFNDANKEKKTKSLTSVLSEGLIIPVIPSSASAW